MGFKTTVNRTIDIIREFTGFALAKPSGERVSGAYLAPEFLRLLSERLHHAMVRAKHDGPLPDAFREFFALFEELQREVLAQWLSETAVEGDELEQRLRKAQRELEEAMKRLGPSDDPPRRV